MFSSRLPAGTPFGGYVIEDFLGAGGMGSVYAAHQVSLARRVALKVISTGLAPTVEEVRRFTREGTIQAKLNHPHVVRVFDRGQEGDWLYIAMELVEGRSLGSEAASLPLDKARALRIMTRLASAVAYLHQKEVVHRDIKPGNIFLTREDQPKLGDFGLSRAPDMTLITEEGMAVGTFRYLSSEVFRGEEYREPSDIYALGVTFYELLTGRAPYRSMLPSEWAKAVCQGEHVPLDEQGTAFGPELVAIVDRMLHHVGSERPTAPQLEGLLQALSRVRASGARPAPARISARTVASSSSVPITPSRSRKLGLGLGLTLMLLVPALGYRSFVSPGKPSTPPSPQPASPGEVRTEVTPVQDRLLARFHERLNAGAGNLRVTRPRPRTDPIHEMFWKVFDPAPPPGGGWASCWTLVLDPGTIVRLTGRLPGPSELLFNGTPVEVTEVKGETRSFDIPTKLLRPGLNRLDIRPGSPITLEPDSEGQHPRDPNRESRDLTADEGRFVSQILDWLYAGRFQQAETQAQEFLARSPGSITALWMLMVVRLSTARFNGHLGDEKVDPTAGTFTGLVAEEATNDDIFPRVAEGGRLVHGLQRTRQNDERLWRMMGEILCLHGEAEMGYDCLMYACLVNPANPYTWSGFYMVYDSGIFRDELLGRRVGEIRETIDASFESPIFPYDVHLENFLKVAAEELDATMKTSSPRRR